MPGVLFTEEGESPLCDVAVIHSVQAGERLSLEGQKYRFH